MDGVWQGLRIAAGSLADPEADCDDAAVVVEQGRIAWVGARADLPAVHAQGPRFDAGGALATPGLVDCHTHLVYAGQRADEFAMRRAGASYEEIARAGGGILSTVRATRAAGEPELLALASRRLRALLEEGVCTLEVKSGYGLDLANERKMLRVARQLERLHGVRVQTTFLGAHALPPEYAGRSDDYIDAVCREMLPALAAEGLVDAVDVFCERIGFSLAQTERVFQAARALGIPVKLHAEQLSNSEGAALAARYGALSAEHLEYAANIDFTHAMAELAHARGAAVEAELGRLSGAEDGLTVEEYEAKLTNPAQAADFVERTDPDMLAVCIGNVHGRYPGEPRLDFERLAAIRQAVPVPLVLHGASGLPPAQISQAIALGVRKLNVNTEVREAYLEALKLALDAPKPPDLIDLMRGVVAAMQAVVAEKLQLFGSVGTV